MSVLPPSSFRQRSSRQHATCLQHPMLARVPRAPVACSPSRTGLLLLGVSGWAAVVWRLLWAVLRLLRYGAEGMFAGDVADRRADRGDITGMHEASVARSEITRVRRRSAALVLFWLVLLIVPTLTRSEERRVGKECRSRWSRDQ